MTEIPDTISIRPTQEYRTVKNDKGFVIDVQQKHLRPTGSPYKKDYAGLLPQCDPNETMIAYGGITKPANPPKELHHTDTWWFIKLEEVWISLPSLP